MNQPTATPRTSSTADAPSWKAFGTRLRQMRVAAAMNPQDLSLGELCSPSMVGEIERGTHSPRRVTVDFLDGRLDARGRLLDAWARTRIAKHLESGDRVERLQSDADRIREYVPGTIPEFFRTDKYNKALLCHRFKRGYHGRELDRLHGERRMLTGTARPPVSVVLDESALRSIVGDTVVTREQLEHFREFVRDDLVTFHVVPTDCRNHPCRGSGFRLLTFSPHHYLAYLPAPCGPGKIVTDPEELLSYCDLYESLKGESLPQKASADLLDHVILSLGNTDQKALTSGPAPASPISTQTATALVAR